MNSPHRKRIAIVLLAFGCVRVVIAQPANDNFVNSAAMPAMTNLITSSNSVWMTAAIGSDRQATRESGEPILNQATYYAGPTTWWNWTAPANGMALIQIKSTNDLAAGLFTGTSVSNLSKLTQGSGSGSFPIQLRLQVHKAIRYELMTERMSDFPVDFAIDIQLLQAPANDDFTNRFILTGDCLSFTGALGLATIEAGEPFPGLQTLFRQSLWWEWTTPSSGNVTLTLVSGARNLTPPRIGVYVGDSIDTLTLVTNGGGVNLPMRISFHAQAGIAYQLDVALGSLNVHPFTVELTRNRAPEISWVSPTNDFVLGPGQSTTVSVTATDTDGTIERVELLVAGGLVSSVTSVTTPPFKFEVGPLGIESYVVRARVIDSGGLATDTPFLVLDIPPANDNFENRIALEGFPVTTLGTNAGATIETGEPLHAGRLGFGTAWWSWLALDDGPTVVTLPTGTAAAGNTLAVYSGQTLNELVPIVSNAGSPGRNNFVRFEAVAGQIYQIAVDCSSSRLGSHFSLSVQSPPSNDHFTNRIVLSGDSILAAGQNYGATDEPGEPRHGGATNQSVWWTWKAPYTHQVELSASSDFSALAAIYTGTNVTALTLIKKEPLSRGWLPLEFPVVQNTDYHIAIDGSFGEVGNLNWTLRPAGVPRISGLTLESGALSFTLQGIPDRWHEIERSTNLVEWESVSTLLLHTNSMHLEFPNWPGSQACFLRAVMKTE